MSRFFFNYQNASLSFFFSLLFKSTNSRTHIFLYCLLQWEVYFYYPVFSAQCFSRLASPWSKVRTRCLSRPPTAGESLEKSSHALLFLATTTAGKSLWSKVRTRCFFATTHRRRVPENCTTSIVAPQRGKFSRKCMKKVSEIQIPIKFIFKLKLIKCSLKLNLLCCIRWRITPLNSATVYSSTPIAQ